MPVVRELITKLTFDVDQAKIRKFDRNIGNIRQHAKELSGNLGEVSAKVRNIGAGLSLFLTTPILLLGKSMITAASDAEESEQKFNVVFKSISEEANKTADSIAKNFGLAGSTARELLGDTGDLLTGFGFTGKSALDLSKQVNELAVDLASFTNFSGGAEGASMALTKALLGERESVKALGISILDKDVKEQVALNRTKGLTHETERQAKAFATLQIAQRQSQNAIGDYARTAGGAANQFRLMGQRVKDLKERFGKLLLPIAVKITGVLIKMVDFLSDLPKPIKIMILSFAGLAAIIGPVILVIGLLGQAIAGIIALGPVLGAVFAKIGIVGLAPFLILSAKVIAVIAAISAAIFLLVDDFKVWKSGGDSVIGALIGNFENFKNKVVSIFNFVKEFFSAFWVAVTEGGEENWDRFIDLLVKGIVGFVKFFVQLFLVKIPKTIEKVAFTVLEIMTNMLSKLGGIIGGFTKSVVKKIGSFLGVKGRGTANETAKRGGKFSTPTMAGFAPSDSNETDRKEERSRELNSKPTLRFLIPPNVNPSNDLDSPPIFRNIFTPETNTEKKPSTFLDNFMPPVNEINIDNEVIKTEDGFSFPSLEGFVPPVANSNNSNVDVKASVTLQVPQGTTVEQQTYIQESAEKIFEGKFQDSINNTIISNRRSEQ